jgi:hypothetical protein
MSKVKPAPLPPDTVIGGYRVVRKLSAGGFGIVYLAVDNDGQQVAIKEYLPASLAGRQPGELLPQVQPEKLSLYRLGLKSFFEEGRSLAQISHGSVVSVLNFFRENETVYMVMNYLEGGTLQDFIITARELKKQKVFRESTIRSSRRCWPRSRPTPAARDCKGANSREHCETNGTGRKHMDQLANAVAHPDLRFATPQARDFRTGSTERWDNPERSRNLNDQIGGQLNPTWVEWLMGWPLGWTDCGASATARFQQWQNSHGKH